MKSLFINISVSELSKATEFYQVLGFEKNESYSNENASAMVYNDSLSVMLLTNEFMKSFLPPHKVVADSHATCAVLNAMQFETKQEVDDFFNKAMHAGAKKTIEYDHGFMYGKDFEDLDGYIREVFWMDEAEVK